MLKRALLTRHRDQELDRFVANKSHIERMALILCLSVNARLVHQEGQLTEMVAYLAGVQELFLKLGITQPQGDGGSGTMPAS